MDSWDASDLLAAGKKVGVFRTHFVFLKIYIHIYRIKTVTFVVTLATGTVLLT